MLRCTVAGLIPLINSKSHAGSAEALFAENQRAFAEIVNHKSYYLLRALPAGMAKALLLPALSEIAAKQLKSGLWRGKNATKATWDILAALNHAGLWQEAGIKVSPLASIRDCHDEYALLIKRSLAETFTKEDKHALEQLKREITGAQDADGSFGNTVTSTVIHMERLLDLGMPQDDPIIRRGIHYLLAQRKPRLQGMHTSEPYDLAVSDVFTTENRRAEFQAALTYRPEWLPRHVCFHTMAVIPNAVCLNLLLRLELEDDPGVSAALTSLYELFNHHGGLCASNIKKPYLKT